MVISMKKIWKDNAKMILTIVISVALASGVSYATVTMYASNTVSYDNTMSGLNSTNVQGALDEIYAAATDYTDVVTRLSAVEDYKNQIYPVGSIYISVSNTDPSTLFGGTWVAFGTGRTLVGINTSDTAFNTVEKTGGEKTHTLTVAEMPSHDHMETVENNLQSGTGPLVAGNTSGDIKYGLTQPSTAIVQNKAGITTWATGGGGAHNNLQPYITVYMWKRTA